MHHVSATTQTRSTDTQSTRRARWAAIGAAIAVSLGAGGIGVVNAVKTSGELPVYTAIEPCRLVDTRPGGFNVGDKNTPLGGGQTHTITATGNSGECTAIPTDVTSVALNVTAVGATQPTHLTIFPEDPRPNASSLNPAPGQPPTPNAVNVDLAAGGTFNVFNFQGEVHLIVDLVGIYQDHAHEDLLSQHIPLGAVLTEALTPHTVPGAGSNLSLTVGVGDKLGVDVTVPEAATGPVDAAVRFRIGASSPDCTVELVVDSSQVRRPGAAPSAAGAATPAQIEITGPSFAVHDYTVTVPDLDPGDVAYIVVQRFNTLPTNCGGIVSLAGVTVDFTAA